MKRLFIFFCFMLSFQALQAQFRFYHSEKAKFLKPGGDTLRHAFTGGMNAPQFSNIDFNNDGIQDIFIFDRTANRSLAFVKTPDGFVHSPQFEGRFPAMQNWALLRDYDGDGLMDIFTDATQDRTVLPDSTKVFPGNLRILKNITLPGGELTFKQYTNNITDTGGWWKDFGTVKKRKNIAINSDNMPCIDDFDGDGDADIMLFEGQNLYASYYENFMKNEYGMEYGRDSTRFIFRDECWGHILYDNTSVKNGFLLQRTYADMAVMGCGWRMYEKQQAHNANTLFMMDYNHDGIQDFVYGDGSFKNMILLTTGHKTGSPGQDSVVAQDTLFPAVFPARHVLYPAGYYVDQDGSGVKDVLVTTNDANAKSVNNVWVYKNTGTSAKPVLTYKGAGKFWAYEESIDLGTRSVPALADVDNDGDDDLIVATSGDFEFSGNNYDRLVLYLNNPLPDGTAAFSLSDTDFLKISKDNAVTGAYPAVADMNGDGRKDIIIGTAEGKLLYYKNNSSGSTPSFSLQTGIFSGIDAGSNAAPAFYDLDKDGDQDIIIGNKDGILKYYRNSGTHTSPVFSATPAIDNFGSIDMKDSVLTYFSVPVISPYGYAAPAIYDLDGNGSPELIVGGESGKVYIYMNINVTPGFVFKRLSDLFVDYSNGAEAKAIRIGRFASPCIGMLDGDDKPDMLTGNISGGLNLYASMPYKPLLGLNEKGKDQARIDLYPNPSSSYVVVNHENIISPESLAVYDLSGRIMESRIINPYHVETTINTSNFVNGIYLLHIRSAKQSYVTKFIVHHTD